MNALRVARCADHARRVHWLRRLLGLYRRAQLFGRSARTRAWGVRGEQDCLATLAEWGEEA